MINKNGGSGRKCWVCVMPCRFKPLIAVGRRFTVHYRIDVPHRNSIKLTIEWKRLNNVGAWMKKDDPRALESAKKLRLYSRKHSNWAPKIGPECICWTGHSASSSTQNCISETAQTCLQDSGRSNVVGKGLYHARVDSCQQMRYKITEPQEFLEQLPFSG